MSTTVGRGSDQYKAPEIISRNKYGTPVDIWGIGCLLYEIFAGHRLFKDSFEIEAYRNGTPLKQLLHPFDQVITTPPSLLSPQDKPIKFSFQVLSAPKREWTGITKIQLGHFWEAFKGMKETNGEVTGKVCEDVAHRLGEINALLRWILNCDPTKRPTAKAVLHHFRGFYLRSMLEDDEVYPCPNPYPN
jgi:serine/threonine protein kinase